MSGLIGVASATVIFNPTTPIESPVGAIPCIEDSAKSLNDRIVSCPITDAKEKANLKSQEIAKLGSIQRELHGKYEIEITDLNAIEGGIEFYVRAWQDNVPVGLGVGKKFEKEHFRIFNPPILVDDPNGTIIREWTDKDTGQLKQRKLREDLREALLRVVEHNIKVTGKKGTAIFGSVGNTTSTFYPDAGTGNTTVDGYARQDTDNTAWGTLVAGAGTEADDTSTPHLWLGFLSGSSSNWRIIWRLIATVNTAAIGTDDITSATWTIFGTEAGLAKVDENSATPTINIYSASPANNNAIAAGDYDSLGSTAFSTAITYAGWQVSDGANDFALNASGISNINKTGITRFGFRNPEYDVANSAPPRGGNLTTSRLPGHLADTAGTATDPKLVVVHAAVGGGAATPLNNPIIFE